jgi:hypothetical protein
VDRKAKIDGTTLATIQEDDMRKILLSIFSTVLLATGLAAQTIPTRPTAAVPPGAHRAGSDPGRASTLNPSMAELNQTYQRLAKTIQIAKSAEFKNLATEIPEFATLKVQKQVADAEAGQIMSAPGVVGSAGPTGILRTGIIAAAPPARKTSGMIATAPSTVCSGMSVATVNRAKTGVIFTTDQSTNLYTITGCGFGNTPGKLYLEGGQGAFPAHGGKLGFVVRTWSDRGIVAMLEPSISGELDQDNVTLVVETATAARGRIQSGPHKFIAARGQPILIPALPKSAFCSTSATAMNEWCPEGVVSGGAIVSPCGAWGLTDCSIEIFRQKPFVTPSQPLVDHFTPKLKPGFVISSVEIQVATLTSSGSSSIDIRTTNPTVNAKQVFIRVPMFEDPIPGTGYDSLYGVKFYAVGPVGISNPLLDVQ